ncbi:hypothetical protein JYT53_00630 [Cytophagaceae bacterium AH-315-L13]|nr:hypothetical protein [Cytophagaceae bacterium AH-315-L13]
MNSKGKWLAVLSIIILYINSHIYGQGCSDAGICSSGSLGSTEINDSSRASKVTISNTLAMGEQFVFVEIVQLGAKLVIFKKLFLDVKLPYQYVIGNLGRNAEMGDLSYSISGLIPLNEDKQLILMGGGTFPMTNTNASSDGKPLPTSYIAGSGTVELLLGASYFVNNWSFSLGYQHAFNRNNNEFLHSEWSGNDKAEKYFESNKLKRGDDVMLRLGKRYSVSDKTLFLSLLPIYRLQEDEIIIDNKNVKLEGSKGLTLNINFGMLYPLTDRIDLRFSYGSPVIWRKVRADGLTRPFVFNAILEYKFI